MATQTRLPIANGSAAIYWMASAGNVWGCVDDPVGTPDDDTTYGYETNSGSHFFYFTPFAISSTSISKVTVTARCRETGIGDPGNWAILPRLYVNGTIYDGTQQTLASAFDNYTSDWLTNPDTAAAWTEDDVEGAGLNPLEEFGGRLVLLAGAKNGRCTQIYITVDYASTSSSSSLSSPSTSSSSSSPSSSSLSSSSSTGSSSSSSSSHVSSSSASSGPLPIFPDAEGFGTRAAAAYEEAGRGVTEPTVYKVTNTNATGAGSFHAAITASGPRVVIFETSGTITYEGSITISSPYLIVAGQTAPSPGITLKGSTLRLNTHDVLMQHVRIRTGNHEGSPLPQSRDCLSIMDNSHNIVIDHCSLSWSMDEVLSLWNNTTSPGHDITISNCILAEPLDDSDHPEGTHGLCLLVAGDTGKAGHDNVSILRNLMANARGRTPTITGDSTTIVANNVSWNCAHHFHQYADARSLGDLQSDCLGNVAIEGDESSGIDTIYGTVIQANVTSTSRVYFNDNKCSNGTGGPATTVQNLGSPNIIAASSQVSLSPLTVLSASATEAHVLSNAGARPSDRDSVDTRVVSEVQARTGTNHVDDQDDVGGWPVLAVVTRSLSIPANPHDLHASGYTNLEVWLHSYLGGAESSSSSGSSSSSAPATVIEGAGILWSSSSSSSSPSSSSSSSSLSSSSSSSSLSSSSSSSSLSNSSSSSSLSSSSLSSSSLSVSSSSSISGSKSSSSSFDSSQWETWRDENDWRAKKRFYLTLTGAADATTDIEIPISSFQARVKTDNPSYLSVVIPDLENRAAAVNARSNGDLIIEMVYEINGRDVLRQEIVRVDLEEIRTDEGPRSESITLSGHKTHSFTGKNITLAGKANYRAVDQGWLRVRAAIDPLLKPGDTVTIGSDTFTAGEVILSANARRQIMEMVESTSSSSSSSSSPSSSSSESSSSESSSSLSSESSSSLSSVSVSSSSSSSSPSSSSLSSSSRCSSSSSLSSSSESSSSLSSSSSSGSSSSESSSSSSSYSMDPEANDYKTVLLIHSDASDGSTTFTDSGDGPNCPHTITAVGNVHHEIERKKFCLSSIEFDGSGDYLSLVDHADWDFDSGNFTIDTWAYFLSLSDENIFEHYFDNNNRALLYLNATNLVFKVISGGVTNVEINAAHGISTGGWHHVALVRNGNTFTAYIDGSSVGSDTDANDYPDYGGSVFIGVNHWSGAVSAVMTGYIDEYRISKGVARWTGNFTPASSPYDYTCS